MQASGKTIVVNPSYENWCYDDEMPGKVRRHITYHMEEEIRHGAPDNPWKNEALNVDMRSSDVARPNNRLIATLLTCVCFISLAALVLIILLMFGKIGERCGCPEAEAAPIALATGSNSDLLARLKILEDNVTSLQADMVMKTNEINDVREQVRMLDDKCRGIAVKLNATKDELQSVDEGIYDRIQNVSANILYRLNKTEDKLEMSDINLAASLDEASTELEKKVNDTILQIQNSEQRLHGIVENSNLTLTEKINTDIDSLKMTVAQSVSELRGRDDEFNTILMMINDSLSEKLMLTSAQLESTDEELRRTLKTVNTSLHAQIDGDVGALRSDINLTRSQLQAADTDLQDAITSVNTSLIATIQDVGDSLDILYTWTNQTKEDLTLFKNSTDHAFRVTHDRIDALQNETNSTRNQLLATDSDVQEALMNINSTLITRIQEVSDTLDVVHNLANQTNEEFILFKDSTDNTLALTEARIDNLQSECNSTKIELQDADANLFVALSDVNITLTLKLENVSKMVGPVGPRGFNGSQGPIGPKGPSGFNGSQGIQGPTGPPGVNGSQGPQGFNGSQGVQGATGPEGPQGAGNFSQCQYLTKVASVTRGISADVLIDVDEESDKKILGVTCSTNDAILTELSSTFVSTRRRYICRCKGTINLPSPAPSMICTIHYWQCPLIT